MSFSSRQRAIESIISRSDFAENIKLQTNFREFNSINFCTMKNIVIDVTFNNANINIIQRILLQKWREVINEDMKLSFDFVIFYHLKNNILKINADKHVKTTLLNDQSHEKSTMQFQIAWNNIFDMFFLNSYLNVFNF
jgi:hypothetical protein